jgi:hypothetical protein
MLKCSVESFGHTQFKKVKAVKFFSFISKFLTPDKKQLLKTGLVCVCNQRPWDIEEKVSAATVLSNMPNELTSEELRGVVAIALDSFNRLTWIGFYTTLKEILINLMNNILDEKRKLEILEQVTNSKGYETFSHRNKIVEYLSEANCLSTVATKLDQMEKLPEDQQDDRYCTIYLSLIDIVERIGLEAKREIAAPAGPARGLE